MDEQQIHWYINDLYRGLNQAWEEIEILKAKVAELEAAKPVEKTETSQVEYEPNPFGVTPEFMLEVLDWAKRTGLFDNAVREYRRSFKTPQDTNQVNIEQVYRGITDRIKGIPSEKYPNCNVGQAFLDYGYTKVRTKDGFIHWAWNTIPWLCFEKWREVHHG